MASETVTNTQQVGDGAQPAGQELADTGVDENLAGALSYLLGFLTGVLFFVVDDRPGVRFHAAQSILLSVAAIGSFVVLAVLNTVLFATLFGGAAIAATVATVFPETAPAALAAAVVGSVFPDLDLYAGHRRTLHYPVYYSALSVPALLAAVVAPSTLTVAVALFLLGAALHSVADMYGGGLELRPWEGNSDRAVYDHHRGKWIAPRRGVRYDGAVEDLALSVGLGVPLLLLVGSPLRQVVIGTLAIAAVYTLLRRRLAEIAAAVIPLLPAAVDSYLPERYR